MSRRKTENFVICRPIEQLFSNKDAIRIRPLRCNYRKFVSRLFIILSECLEVFNKINSGLCRLDIRSHCVWTPVFLIRMLNAPDIVKYLLVCSGSASSEKQFKRILCTFCKFTRTMDPKWDVHQAKCRSIYYRAIREHATLCRLPTRLLLHSPISIGFMQIATLYRRNPFRISWENWFYRCVVFFFGKLSGA